MPLGGRVDEATGVFKPTQFRWDARRGVEDNHAYISDIRSQPNKTYAKMACDFNMQEEQRYSSSGYATIKDIHQSIHGKRLDCNRIPQRNDPRFAVIPLKAYKDVLKLWYSTFPYHGWDVKDAMDNYHKLHGHKPKEDRPSPPFDLGADEDTETEDFTEAIEDTDDEDPFDRPPPRKPTSSLQAAKSKETHPAPQPAQTALSGTSTSGQANDRGNTGDKSGGANKGDGGPDGDDDGPDEGDEDPDNNDDNDDNNDDNDDNNDDNDDDDD